MALVNLNIAPIANYTAKQRAYALSEELLRIKKPFAIKGENDIAAYLYRVIEHPTEDKAVMVVNPSDVIMVHPQNNLTNLIALMPDLPQQVQAGLVQLIQNSETITFGQLLTGEETTYTDEELEAKGFYNNENNNN